MTSLRSLVRRGDTGTPSPLARRIAVGLAVLTPLLIAGVAVTALQGPAGSEAGAAAPTSPSTASPSTATASPSPSPSSTASPAPTGPVQTAAATGGPLLPAAVVNEDTSVSVAQADGTETPVLIGKLLTTDLTDGTSGQGFSWTITDADTASAGLADGRFAAVVTIPSDFTSSYLSISSDSPTQAQLQVQTNAGDSYATSLLATALSTDLQAAVADQATYGYVTNTLEGFAALSENVGKAASGATEIAGLIDQSATGADELAGGLTTIADEGGAPLTQLAEGVATGVGAIAAGTSDLPAYANALAEGSAGVTAGIDLLKGRLADEAAASYAIDARQQALEAGIAALRDDVPTLSDEEIAARLDGLQLEAAGIRISSFTVTLGLGLDALGVTALEDVSTTLTDAQSLFAADLPLLTTSLTDAAAGTRLVAEGTAGLTTAVRDAASAAGQFGPGLRQLSSAQSELAGGLGEIAGKVPAYTTEQQEQIATVVTNPIVTDQSDVASPPTSAAAIAAVAVPLALWLGAFAIYLMLVPFTRRALESTASTFRVVVSALVPAVVLAVVQAAIVAAVLFAVGAHPAHLVGSILFTVLMSLVFVTLHQGLVALFGQAGRLVSLALVVVQVAAAAVIIPSGLSAPFYTGISTVLPLSHAITGMQALITGGSLQVAGQAAAVLVVFGLIGFVLSLVAAARQRSRDVIVRVAGSAPTGSVAPPPSRAAVTAG